MDGTELGKVTLEIVPTKHFALRCKERLDGIWPESPAGLALRISGTLVRGRKPGIAYLDVDGIGRFVIALCEGDILGITYLPEIHCHQSRSV